MRGKRTFIVGVLIAALLPLLGGCSSLVVLDPRGPIGEAERTVILEAVGLMLIVVVPVILLSLWIPWHYRAGNIIGASPRRE